MQDIFIKGIVLLYAHINTIVVELDAHINTIVVELDPRVENINIYARVKVIVVYHDAVNAGAFVIENNINTARNSFKLFVGGFGCL